MPGLDPTHWLHRLTSEEWLAAAKTELRLCDEALSRRSYRAGVTHARRAAGMAWNAVLARHEDDRYGRSYMDHVVALGADETAPEEVRAAARLLRGAPARPPELIAIGRPDKSTLDAAQAIVAHAQARATDGARPQA